MIFGVCFNQLHNQNIGIVWFICEGYVFSLLATSEHDEWIMNRASIQVPIDPYSQDAYGKVLDRTITIQSVHNITKSTLLHASTESFTVAIKDDGILAYVFIGQ